MGVKLSRRLSINLFFAIGFFEQIAQISAFRQVFVNFKGSELSFGLVLGVWLLFMGAGTLIAPRIRKCRLASPFMLAGLVFLLALSVPVTVHLFRVVRVLMGKGSGEVIPLLSLSVSTIIILAPLCLLLGLLHSTSLLYDEKKLNLGSARAYLLDATGSLFAGALFSFLLVELFNPIGVVLLASAYLTFSVLLVLRKHVFPLVIVLTACLIVLVAIPLSPHLEKESQEAKWQIFTPGMSLVEVLQSRYGEIAVTKWRDQYNFYLDSQLQKSYPDDYPAASRINAALIQHPHPRSLLMLGGSIGQSLNEIKRYRLERIDFVELDPQLIDTVARYVPTPEVKNLEFHFIDARRFVKKTEKRYDVIIIDMPAPLTRNANRFYTLEFFGELKRILNPGGTVALGIQVDIDPQRENLFLSASIVKTLKRVFHNVLALPTEGFIFASDARLVSDWKVLYERYRRLTEGTEPTKFFQAECFSLIYQEGPVERTNRKILAYAEKREVRINTDATPSTIGYMFGVWSSLLGEKESILYRFIDSIRFWHFAVLSFLVLLFCVGARIRGVGRGKTAAVYSAIMCLGVFGLTVEISVLHALQSAFGFVYLYVGIFNAAFMGGLALGSIWALNHKEWQTEGLLTCVFVALLILGLAAVAVKWMAVLGDSLLIIACILNLTAGACVGAAFRFALATRKDAASSAGRLYGADLIGATLGALLIGSAASITLGLVASFAASAIILVSSALSLLLFSGKPGKGGRL
ncbi:MAG: hypothetical protein GXO71_07300 [Caldiserica bacterium]|nr:hypothetical protein [Caldisericota bacterium]